MCKQTHNNTACAKQSRKIFCTIFCTLAGRAGSSNQNFFQNIYHYFTQKEKRMDTYYENKKKQGLIFTLQNVDPNAPMISLTTSEKFCWSRRRCKRKTGCGSERHTLIATMCSREKMGRCSGRTLWQEDSRECLKLTGFRWWDSTTCGTVQQAFYMIKDGIWRKLRCGWGIRVWTWRRTSTLTFRRTDRPEWQEDWTKHSSWMQKLPENLTLDKSFLRQTHRVLPDWLA